MFSFAWRTHYDTHEWLVGWLGALTRFVYSVALTCICFRRTSNTKCYYSQLLFFVAWVPQPTDVED
jgi:hypothetical protein